MEENNNGNIIQNANFLQQNHNLMDQFQHQLNNLNNLLANIIHNHQNMNQTQNRVLNFFSIHNFNYRSHICNDFRDIGYNCQNSELQQFNINIVNNEIPGLVLPNMLNQYNNITFEQLSYYVANTIYILMINNINRIINIINAWDGEDVNDLIYQIIDATSTDYYRMDNIINSFLNFCNNHLNQMDQIDQNVVEKMKHRIELFHHMLEVNKTYMHIKFFNQVEEIQQIVNNNNLLNSKLHDKCTRAIYELSDELITRQVLQNDGNINFKDEANLILEFSRIYNSMIARLDDEDFVSTFTNEFPESFKMTYDDVKKTVTFAKQLANDITIHIAYMLINIRNRMLQNNLTSQQLRTFIRTSVLNCINDVQDALYNVRLQLMNKNNILQRLDKKTNFVKLAIDFINTGNTKLNALKERYHLQH